MTEELDKRCNFVAIYASDKRLLTHLAKEYKLRSRSAMLHKILTEWLEV